jgi:hypothetical protein
VIGRHFDRALALVVLVLALLMPACRPAAPAVPAPSGDELADLEALVAVGQVTASIGRAVCAQLGQASPCHGLLDALDDGLTVAAAALVDAQACQVADDRECVARAVQTARDHLPELRRLVRAAMGAAGAR